MQKALFLIKFFACFYGFSLVTLALEISSNEVRFGESIDESILDSLVRLNFIKQKCETFESNNKAMDMFFKGISTISVTGYLLTQSTNLVMPPLLLNSFKIAGLLGVGCSLSLKYYSENQNYRFLDEFSLELNILIERLYRDTNQDNKLFKRIKHLQRVLSENDVDFDLNSQKDLSILFKVNSNPNFQEDFTHLYNRKLTLDEFLGKLKDLAKKYLHVDDLEVVRNSISVFLIVQGLRINNLYLAFPFQSSRIQEIINDISLVAKIINK
jgi:hypothetical protein